MIATSDKTKFTPPEIARRWGIKPDKIIGWIRSGELAAMNAATKPGGRPRYLIDVRDVEAFELKRSVTPAKKTARPRWKQVGTTEYF